MSVRLRRLISDYEAIKHLIHAHPRIEIEGVAGSPPERYRFVLRTKSLRYRGTTLELAEQHRVEIILPRGYPREPPYCRMLTPVFHPNIDPATICVGDHWTAAESLPALIQRIGEMLAYQSYNVKSPRNGEAARWVEENPGAVPIDKEPFFLDLDAAPPVSERATRCSNCGAVASIESGCPAGHWLCPDCALQCPRCERTLCLACGVVACPDCAEE